LVSGAIKAADGHVKPGSPLRQFLGSLMRAVSGARQEYPIE
jgi:hypothetical protein